MIDLTEWVKADFWGLNPDRSPSDYGVPPYPYQLPEGFVFENWERSPEHLPAIYF